MEKSSSSSEKKAFVSGVWYTICNFLIKSIAIITTPIFTRIMTQGHIGQYANFSSWVSMLSILFTFDLYTSVSLAYYKYKKQFHYFLSEILLVGSGISLVFYGIFCVFQDSIRSLLSLEPYMIHIMFIYMLFVPATQIITTKYRMEYDYKRTVLLSFSLTFFPTVVSLLLVYHFPANQLYSRIIGHYGITIFISILVYISILRKGHRKGCHKIDKTHILFAFSIALPMILHLLSGTILSSSDRVMITSICGDSKTALYSIAYNCTFPVSLLWSSMNTAWAPWGFEKLDKKDYSAMSKASKPYILGFFTISFMILLFAPDLLLLMGGKSYMKAVYIIPPIILGYAFQFIYSLYVNIELFYKKQKNIALGTAIAAIANIGLNALLIPVYGYIAAAYTTLIGYIILFVIHFLIVKGMGYHFIYNLKFNIIGLLSFSCVCVIINVIYRFPLLRYSIIAIISGICLIVGFIFRKKLIVFFKNLKSKL